MPIRALGERRPQLDATAYVADGAQVIGEVVLGPDTSVWFNAVLRGDTERITIGAGSNVQDGAILHADPGFPCTVGAGVVTGHGAILHGCQIGDNCLIGMGAVILNGATIGVESIVGAGTLVPEGKAFLPRSLLLGTPARVVRQVTDEDLEGIAAGARHYQDRARIYRTQLADDEAGTR
jgi:carbonic anhydrase/acetyltransferase-like protein (isoleucine patch superfamily)